MIFSEMSSLFSVHHAPLSDYSDINLENDIALIRLEAPIVFNSNISNITLSTSLPDQGTTLFVAGELNNTL